MELQKAFWHIAKLTRGDVFGCTERGVVYPPPFLDISSHIEIALGSVYNNVLMDDIVTIIFRQRLAIRTWSQTKPVE